MIIYLLWLTINNIFLGFLCFHRVFIIIVKYDDDKTYLFNLFIRSFQNVVFLDSEKCSCSIVNPTDGSAPPKTFTFDGVYGPDSNTEQIYNDIAYPFVEVCIAHTQEIV